MTFGTDRSLLSVEGEGEKLDSGEGGRVVGTALVVAPEEPHFEFFFSISS